MAHQSIGNLKGRLADGLTAWLTFEFECERGYLFSEKSLAHAVGQLVRSHGASVKAEVPHPTLALDGATGRPQSLDFVVYDPQVRPVVGVEIKWAGNSSVTAGALAWDAFRLEAFARFHGVPGLMILAGTKRRIAALLDSDAFHRNDGRTMFPVKSGGHRLVLHHSDLAPSPSRYVEGKAEGLPSGTVASSLCVSLPRIAKQPGSNSIHFVTYVWQITPGS